MVIQNEHNGCLIHQNNLVAKSSSPGQKLQTALHLFNYLIYWNLISIDILKLKRNFFRQRSFRVVRGLFEQSEVILRSFLAY